MKKALNGIYLTSLVTLFSLVTAASRPTQAHAASTAYSALVVKSPKSAYDDTVVTLEAAFNQSQLGTWADRGAYGKAAKRLHIRDPYTAKAAKRVGHELGLTEVLFVTLHSVKDAGESKMFAEVELVDVARGTVVVHRSYFLPDRRMTEGTAAYVADFLAMRQGEAVENDVADSQDGQPTNAPPAFGEMHGRDLDDVPAAAPAPAPTVQTTHVTKRHRKSPVAFLNGLL